MEIRLLKTVLLLILLSLFQTIYCQEELLIVRGDGNYLPHEMYREDKLTGTHIELITLAAESLGIKIRFRTVPWSRAIEMIEHGYADAITFMGKTEEREKFAIFDEGNSLSPSLNGFFILREKISPLKPFEYLTLYL